MFAPEHQLVEQQDDLRVVRAFVGALNGYLGDQSYARQDGYSANVPGQFMTIGPQGVAVEGTPVIAQAPSGGIALSPVVMWLAFGALLYAVFKG